MSLKRRVLLGSGLLLGIVAMCSLIPRSSISEENYSKVHKGMTFDEVADILGPPGNYVQHPEDCDGFLKALLLDPIESKHGETVSRWWCSDRMAILVSFNAKEERVAWTWHTRFQTEPFLDRLRRALRRVLRG